MDTSKVLATAACVIAAGAVGVAMTNPGPTGPQGEQGITGKQGMPGKQGKAGSPANVVALKACLPEFVTWVESFRVDTTTNTGGNAYWLTSAYLNTSSQQVSAGCRKVLGFGNE